MSVISDSAAIVFFACDTHTRQTSQIGCDSFYCIAMANQISWFIKVSYIIFLMITSQRVCFQLVSVSLFSFFFLCDNTDNCDISFWKLNIVKCELIVLFARVKCVKTIKCALILDFDRTFFLASFAFKHIQKSISNNSM